MWCVQFCLLLTSLFHYYMLLGISKLHYCPLINIMWIQTSNSIVNVHILGLLQSIFASYRSRESRSIDNLTLCINFKIIMHHQSKFFSFILGKNTTELLRKRCEGTFGGIPNLVIKKGWSNKSSMWSISTIWWGGESMSILPLSKSCYRHTFDQVIQNRLDHDL